MKQKNWFLILIIVFSLIFLTACAPRASATPTPYPTAAQSTTVITPVGTGKSTQIPDGNQVIGYPKITNLWGLYRLDKTAELYANFDLLIPYSFKEDERVSAEIYQLNPQALILHYQFGTKGREELDDLIHEWWIATKNDPGYPCLFRDSKGTILISDGWKHPMVNLINEYCRTQMAQKNINELLNSGKNLNGEAIYTGIYWDLLFGKITSFADGIDSDLDGKPDTEDELNAAYLRGVIDFLRQIRLAYPNAQLMGNEAPIDYAPLINGRLFEWQIPALLDGSELNSWEEITNNYRQWSISGVEPKITTIQNAPEVVLIEKYGTNHVGEIPEGLLEEAAASYQRMRFGLASSLMGDGYYSYDLGATFHGQFWWYDEYGRMITEDGTSTLPPQGYLGQPEGDPYTIKSTPESHVSRTFQQFIKELIASPQEDIKSYEVWVRKFEHGLVVVNPTETVRSLELDAQYCRLNGTQAPLSTVRIDDNEIEYTDGWKELTATYDQFGNTVRTITNVKSATLTYRPNLLYSGQYEVFVWVAPGVNQVDKVDYEVIYDGGDLTVSIDQTAGDPGWRSLGIYSFVKGNDQKVKIRSSAAGSVVADAIKWVSLARFNDGSQVTKFEIQPFDGVILVNCEVNEGGF